MNAARLPTDQPRRRSPTEGPSDTLLIRPTHHDIARRRAPRGPSEEYAGPRGLANEGGNICYVISILAAIRAVAPLRRRIDTATVGGPIREAIRDSFREMDRADTSRPVSPGAIVDALSHGMFRDGCQHDAHEALVRIMTDLSTEGTDVATLTRCSKSIRLICSDDRCPSIRDGVDTMNDVMVPIYSSLHAALRVAMWDAVNGTEEVAFACPECASLTATRTMTWGAPPEVLIVNLLRTHPMDLTQRIKVRNPMHIASHLVMGATYTLRAIITHLGESRQNGHYVCDAFDIVGQTVMTHNDGIVTRRTDVEQAILERCRDAYIIMYEKV